MLKTAGEAKAISTKRSTTCCSIWPMHGSVRTAGMEGPGGGVGGLDRARRRAELDHVRI